VVEDAERVDKVERLPLEGWVQNGALHQIDVRQVAATGCGAIHVRSQLQAHDPLGTLREER